MFFCAQECHRGGLAGDNAVLSRREGLWAWYHCTLWAEREWALWHWPGLRLLCLLHLLLLLSGEQWCALIWGVPGTPDKWGVGVPAVSAKFFSASLSSLLLLPHIHTLHAVEELDHCPWGQGAPQNPWWGDSLVDVFAASRGKSLWDKMRTWMQEQSTGLHVDSGVTGTAPVFFVPCIVSLIAKAYICLGDFVF